MLFKALVRPVANTLCQVPSRSTSAVVGAKSRHVSTVVSINCKYSDFPFVCLHLEQKITFHLQMKFWFNPNIAKQLE